ncbi:MAG TPA: response regulator [Actinoplanes sp.]|nr:response regulator [Actinoplanes sp.]
MALRCLIVDDSAVFLSAATMLLESEGVAVTVASNTREALHRIDDVDPDVVLIDFDLGEERGSDLVELLAGRTRRSGEALPTIVISTHDPADFAELLSCSYALGFLSKAALSADAIRTLMRGDHRGQKRTHGRHAGG